MRYDFKTITAAVLLVLAGCSYSDVPDPKPTTGRPPTVAEVPDADETVRGSEDPPIVTLELGSKLHERSVSGGEELPGEIIVPNTNLNSVPVTSALQAVLSGTDISLSWDAGGFENRLVTVTNLSGSLPAVVRKICSSAKVFCGYRHGLLEIKEKDTFIIDLPSIPSSTTAGAGGAANSMADTIKELVGDKVQIDAQGGNLIYTADVLGQERVHEYLAQLRNGRPLVVLQLYIWEVRLSNDNGTGINWSNFKFPKVGGAMQNAILTGSTAFTNLASPGVTLNANFSGKVDAETVLEFLATQGRVQTISNPQMTFVSGQVAEFRVGGEKRYISSVGQLTNSSVTGSNATNTGIGTNTISTDVIQTGLTVNIGGTYENGIISANLLLTTEDIVSLNPTPSGGQVIDLPETAKRKVSTIIRVRPGDNLVMAGLVTSRDTNDREGIPLLGGRIPTRISDQYENSELVILVKPSVVLFSDKNVAELEKQKEKIQLSGGGAALPDAIFIDKDGPRTIKIPAVDNVPVDLKASGSEIPSFPPAKPELMVAEPDPTPLGDVPISPSEDGAPVDRRLMQRGFSHAFDELLSPVPDRTSSADGLLKREKTP